MGYSAKEKELERQATQLLRSEGFSWAGRKKISFEEWKKKHAFERRIIYTPINGKLKN